ncbi:MAG: hypothetical protein V2J20_02780 [Wenzhouxiangella sp.]|jgi:hypothetical protein|nr:hypothetical protein [Wenzhouxiangella sp.]
MQYFRTAFLGIFALSLCFTPCIVLAQAFGLSDMMSDADSATSDDVSSSGEVVVAESMGAAAQQAHALLIAEGSGVRLLAVGSGTGIMATGQSGYRTYDNINATLLSKRAAFQRAGMQAKRFLVENFQGPDIACEAMTDDFLQAVDTASESVANQVSIDEEGCQSAIRGALSGFVTYQVDDDVENKTVSVSLISTPRTREGITASSGALVVSTEPAEVFNSILADLASGVTPPVGARLIVNPVSGENVTVAFGSAIRRQNSNPNIRRRLVQAADDQARMRSQAALIGVLQGEDVYWSGSFDESQVEGSAQFEVDPSLEAEEAIQVLNEEKSTFLSTLSTQDEYRVVQAGQLPPGVNTRTFASEDGYWSFAVSVFSPSLNAEAVRAANEMRAAREPGSVGAVTGPSGRALEYGGPNDDAENPQGPSGRVSDKEKI